MPGSRLPDLEEGFLRRVLRLGPIPEDGETEAVHGAFHLAVQRLERPGFPPGNPGQRFFHPVLPARALPVPGGRLGIPENPRIGGRPPGPFPFVPRIRHIHTNPFYITR